MPTLEIRYTYKSQYKYSFTDREGFEPPEAFTSSVFKTDAINHSTTCPMLPVRLELTSP